MTSRRAVEKRCSCLRCHSLEEAAALMPLYFAAVERYAERHAAAKPSCRRHELRILNATAFHASR